MSITDGGPAFPRPISVEPNGDIAFAETGMSLRDYFAGQALAVLNYHNVLATVMTPTDVEPEIRNVAALSYRIADAMLKERESAA